jgi:uncharacterized ferritin-like protein (DUF455 family)
MAPFFCAASNFPAAFQPLPISLTPDIERVMMAQETHFGQVLVERSVWRKLDFLEGHLHGLLRGEGALLPDTPGRDVQILPIRDLPPKKGLSSREGQARLLHDLASIELQAMELAVRTLIEFPEAPADFRAELAQVASEEGKHLRLCVEGLQELGFPWGTFAAHNGLWMCVSREDSLLDRIVIVHRYLEGSGLDASATILRRLSGVGAHEALRAVEVIGRDEVAHVQFGSRWYHRLLQELIGVDASDDFRMRLERLFTRIPRRLEPIDRELRLSAGFTNAEIQVLQDVQRRHS